jgi:2-methylcitrate synthase/citrate synthase II
MSEVHRGLAGVVAGTTAISVIDDETGTLLYRGYPAPDLAAACSFEEVAYLIWHGELPERTQLSAFEQAERRARALPEDLVSVVKALPLTSHPMDVVRTAVSWLGASAAAQAADDMQKALDLLAKLPTVVAIDQRRRHGQEPVPPDETLSFSENFFHMCFGTVPGRRALRCFETSLVLYAEHGFNASTFTARVISSTLSDLYSAVTGAIGALKGPLHGGANEAVMAMFAEIETEERVAPWLQETLAAGRKVMGFGHRIYKHGDSRVPTMRAALDQLAALSSEGQHLMALYDRLEEAVIQAKGLYPNVDYVTGPAYHLMGFDTPSFTPIFVMSRTTGWTAHVMEQLADNALIRPLSLYTGPARRQVPARSGPH